MRSGFGGEDSRMLRAASMEMGRKAFPKCCQPADVFIGHPAGFPQPLPSSHFTDQESEARYLPPVEGWWEARLLLLRCVHLQTRAQPQARTQQRCAAPTAAEAHTVVGVCT